MTYLAVDPATLRSTGRRLRDAVEVAHEVRGEGRALAGLVTDAGHERFSDAVQTFMNKWSHGIGCLIEDAETLATMLSDAGTAYAGVEASIAQACGPGD